MSGVCVCEFRALNYLLECLYPVIKTECNEDAARVFTTYYQKATARFRSSIDCTHGRL